MKLKLMLMSLLINNNYKSYNEEINKDELLNKMINPETKKEYENLGLDIKSMIKNKLTDDDIYKLVAEKLVNINTCAIYIPAISLLSSLLLIIIFTFCSKNHEGVKDGISTKDIFNFYLERGFIKLFLFSRIMSFILNIGIFFLIQKYQFNLQYIIGIAIFIPIFNSIVQEIIQKFFTKKQTLKEILEDLDKIFKSEYNTSNENTHLYAKYGLCELLNGGLLMVTYIVYFGYNTNNINKLQIKASTVKKNTDLAETMRYLNQNNLTKDNLNDIQNIVQENKQNNYGYPSAAA
jgi:hypothetical protein